MKGICISFPILLLFFLLVSCNQEEAIPANIKPSSEFFKTNSDTILIDGQSTEGSLIITSNCNWTIRTNGWDDTHATPDHGEGNQTVTITTPINEAPISKKGTLIITTGGGLEKTVTILHRPGKIQLQLSETEHTFEYGGGTWGVTVICNTDWTANGNADGFSYTPVNGSGVGKIDITAKENIQPLPRSFVLTVTAGTEQVQFTVNQKGRPTITVTPITISVAAVSSNSVISIVCNSEWTATADQSWIIMDKNSGSGDDTVTLTCSDNTSTASRTATITFSVDGQSQQVIVTQNGATLPTVSKVTAAEVKLNDATITANYTSDNYPVIEYGIYYGTTNNPVSDGTHLQFNANANDGTMSIPLSGLKSGITYYYCVYATTVVGTTLSDVQSFTTNENRPGTDDNVTPNI